MPLVPTLRDGAAHKSIGAGGAGGGTVAVAEAVAEAVAVGKDADIKADLEGEPDATDRDAEVDLEGDEEGRDDRDGEVDLEGDEEGVVCTQNIKSVESKLGEYTHPYEAPCNEHVGPFTISHPVKRVLQITSAFSWMNAHVGSLAHDVPTDSDDTEYPVTGIKAKAKAPTSRSIYFSMRYKRKV